MNKKSGVAIVIVLFFCFAIALLLFFMTKSNTNLAFQNKQALRQMQAYYLAHSGMQHAKLQLRLLPKETFEFFDKNGSGNAYRYVNSSEHTPLALGTFDQEKAKYDLFNPENSKDEDFPYGGEYFVDSITLEGSHKNMRQTQDGYKIHVKSSVDGGRNKKFSDELTEQIIVSRFTGGIK
jgi:hypothetical protein